MGVTIRCDLTACGCPAARGLYTMRYVSPDLRVVFHDNPKAASTTLREALGIFPMRGEFANGFVMADFDRPDPTGDDWFRFGFVRNPWDRLLSAWTMFRRDRPGHLEAMFGRPAGDVDFPDFVHGTESVRNHHWEEQWKFVPPEELDFVGRVETFDRDMERIRGRLGLPATVLPRRNATEHDRYSAYYDDATRAVVATRWARDVERFGYEFGGDPPGDVSVGDSSVGGVES